MNNLLVIYIVIISQNFGRDICLVERHAADIFGVQSLLVDDASNDEFGSFKFSIESNRSISVEKSDDVSRSRAAGGYDRHIPSVTLMGGESWKVVLNQELSEGFEQRNLSSQLDVGVKASVKISDSEAAITVDSPSPEMRRGDELGGRNSLAFDHDTASAKNFTDAFRVWTEPHESGVLVEARDGLSFSDRMSGSDEGTQFFKVFDIFGSKTYDQSVGVGDVTIGVDESGPVQALRRQQIERAIVDVVHAWSTFRQSDTCTAQVAKNTFWRYAEAESDCFSVCSFLTRCDNRFSLIRGSRRFCSRWIIQSTLLEHVVDRLQMDAEVARDVSHRFTSRVALSDLFFLSLSERVMRSSTLGVSSVEDVVDGPASDIKSSSELVGGLSFSVAGGDFKLLFCGQGPGCVHDSESIKSATKKSRDYITINENAVMSNVQGASIRFVSIEVA